jgi:hypothetical protein
MSWGTCGLRYIQQVIVSGSEMLRCYDLKLSKKYYVIARVLAYFQNRLVELGLGEDCDTVHIKLCRLTDDDIDFPFPTPDFFREYRLEIQDIGKYTMGRALSLQEIQEKEAKIATEMEWYEGRWCSEEILLFGSELLKTFEFGRYDQGIILNTLSFLFENWKDMRQEEWNDPYILLEELMNNADFPKTEKDQKTNTDFCKQHVEAICAFGLALQEDLKRRGFFKPKESATARFFRENPHADPFKKQETEQYEYFKENRLKARYLKLRSFLTVILILVGFVFFIEKTKTWYNKMHSVIHSSSSKKIMCSLEDATTLKFFEENPHADPFRNGGV